MYQPPTGVRDLLPSDVLQKLWIEERLQRVFQQWGYQRIITPTLERIETLQASGSVDLSGILQLRDAEGASLGLRPDPTPSLARAVATRLIDTPWPVRLSYQTNVFRSTARPQEFYQAGIELIGAGGAFADGEVLLLLNDALQALGLSEWTLILGAVGFTRSWLSAAPEALRPHLRQALSSLDRVALEAETSLDPELKRALLLLFDLRGEPKQVLAKAHTLALSDAQRQDLQTLQSLVGWLEAQGITVILDLSLVEAFDYYTGMVFEICVRDCLLGRGGRYDELLASYGRPAPGVGFSLNLEALQQVLVQDKQRPLVSRPEGGVLIVPKTPQAWSHALAKAAHLRSQSPERVELELLGRSPEAVLVYAEQIGVAQVLWVDADGTTA